MSSTQATNSGLTTADTEMFKALLKQVTDVNIKKLAEDMKITPNACRKRLRKYRAKYGVLAGATGGDDREASTPTPKKSGGVKRKSVDTAKDDSPSVKKSKATKSKKVVDDEDDDDEDDRHGAGGSDDEY